MSIWCDRIFTSGLLLLIFLTPLAFGAVHPWAFALVETSIFLLVIVWMTKLWHTLGTYPADQLSPGVIPNSWRPILLPVTLFLGLVGFQLLPLPPAVLQLVSPATSEVYTNSLLGWPDEAPYAQLLEQAVTSPAATSPDQVSPIPNPQSPIPNPQLLTPNPQPPIPNLSHWRPLSLAPSLTQTGLFKFLAYVALFCCVGLYPFGAPEQGYSSAAATQRFLRLVLLTVLLSGLLVASLGVLQRLTWNGKILWFFVPYDWQSAQPGEQFLRACGPFVNPDHFANYLALVFPLALAGSLSPQSFVLAHNTRPFRLLCGLVMGVLLMAILLSLSRSVWLGLLLSCGIVGWVFLLGREDSRPALLRKSKRAVRWGVSAGVLLVVLALFLVGPTGRSHVAERLEETLSHNAGLGGRFSVWSDMFGMVRDFPLFGVGLGAWPEVFPRYQRPPWTPNFQREAHNDYLEIMAETGLIGFGLLVWAGWQVGRRLRRGLGRLGPSSLPVVAAVLGGLGMLAFHESVDFSLQIPANAVLFTLLLAVGLRVVQNSQQNPELDAQLFRRREAELVFRMSAVPTATQVRRFPRNVLGTGLGAVCLVLFALGQERLPYPYSLPSATSVAEAVQAIADHPSQAALHVSLFRLLPQDTPAGQRLTELKIALWLAPHNPLIRDLYAARLFQLGRRDEALQEVTRSVFLSPAPATHRYLTPRLIPWLSAQEQHAIEQGFRQALAVGNEAALPGLGDFYTALGRFSEAGQLYADAASGQTRPEKRFSYLIEAARVYSRAGEQGTAERLFGQAAAVSPDSPEPYRDMATLVYAPQGKLDQAKAVIAEGIRRGADPFSLSLALADAARQKDDLALARLGLLHAVKVRPLSFLTHLRLGRLYMQEKNYDRAVLSLRTAVKLNPRSGPAFFSLGNAEEERYQLLAAEKAYARAAALEPRNADFQHRYQALQHRIAQAQG